MRLKCVLRGRTAAQALGRSRGPMKGSIHATLSAGFFFAFSIDSLPDQLLLRRRCPMIYGIFILNTTPVERRMELKISRYPIATSLSDSKALNHAEKTLRQSLIADAGLFSMWLSNNNKPLDGSQPVELLKSASSTFTLITFVHWTPSATLFTFNLTPSSYHTSSFRFFLVRWQARRWKRESNVILLSL